MAKKNRRGRDISDEKERSENDGDYNTHIEGSLSHSSRDIIDNVELLSDDLFNSNGNEESGDRVTDSERENQTLDEITIIRRIDSSE